MDSRSRLDYALFQLTPTRTRCDLVICAGDYKEKLASGLLEPFIAHLQFAKDQISKGGYSITLSASAPWFTKSTLERFVRFVSTPEVLERSITIEKEIANIDSSLNINNPSDSQTVYGLEEQSNNSSNLAYKHEGNTVGAVHEEDPKVHLQRVLETRKAVLQKEQAMVYARALVAGFEPDSLEDLICFSDAFGSPRLREACLSFMELCNTKSNDRVWMDEVAAMQAYSRSIILREEDEPNQELRINVPNGNFSDISHGIHLPQYMHTYQGNPMFHPPYQGCPYPFPPMLAPPYYQENRMNHSQKKRLQDGDFDSSDSSSESETRSSSRKTVIRNINYINSTKDAETDYESDDNSTNNDDDDEQGHKVIHQWNIFQNLLLKDADEKEFEEVKNPEPEFPAKSLTDQRHKAEDLFLGSFKDEQIHEKSRDIFEDCFQPVINKKDVLVDESLAVQTRSLNESSGSHLRKQDISMVMTKKDLYSPSMEGNEPNDLYIVLERDTSGQEMVPNWTPEMEMGNIDVKIVKVDSADEKKLTQPKSRGKDLVKKGLERKVSTIEEKSKALVGSRSKKPTGTKTTTPKGKSEKEEEKRKKMEELLAQRQKRIAERSAKNDKPKAQDMKNSNKTVIKSSTINRLSTAHVINQKVLPSDSNPRNKPAKLSPKKINESKPSKVTPKKIVESKPLKMATKKISEPKPLKMATKKISEPKPSYKPAKMANKKIGESKPTKMATKKISELKPAKVATKKISESKPTKMPTKKIGESSRAKMATKNNDLKNSNEPKKSDNMKLLESESSHKASLVVKEDKAFSVGNGGSNKKSSNTVSFKINEDYGAKENPSVKLNSVIEISTPPPPTGKGSPEKNNSRKKWSTIETSSKALSGFKKLLSFGRRR